MTDQAHQIVAGLGRLAAFGRARLWQEAARLGLNPTQAEILSRIVQRPQRARDLAAHLGVSPASLSDSVASLVTKGLALRRADPGDGRARLVCATPRGQEVAGQIPIAAPALSEVVGALPETDRAQLVTSLIRIILGLQDAGAIPVQRMCVTCRHFRPHAHQGAQRPHHCALTGAVLGDSGLRIDCHEHDEAPTGDRALRFARPERI